MKVYSKFFHNSYFIPHNSSGVTLIELLLVISIIAILGAATSPFLANFVLQTNFDTTIDKVVSSIRKSQGNAMNKKNNAIWGICKNGTNIRLYSGSCASPTIKEDFTIPSSVTVTNLNDTTFNLRGEPSSAMFVTINTNQETATVTVNVGGGINTN